MMHVFGFPMHDAERVVIPLSASPDLTRPDDALCEPYAELDVAWRLRLAGYSVEIRSVAAPRLIQNWYCMERSRMIMLCTNYEMLSLLILFPAFVATQLAILSAAIHGGWWRDELRALWWFLRPTTWVFLMSRRREAARFRRLPDRLLAQQMVSEIVVPTLRRDAAIRLIQPFLRVYVQMFKIMIGLRQ